MKCPYNESHECKEIDEWDENEDPNAEYYPCVGCEYDPDSNVEPIVINFKKSKNTYTVRIPKQKSVRCALR